MAAPIYKGTEGNVYIQDPDSENDLIPDSGLSLTAPADANRVGRVESFSIRLENNVDEYFGIGDRDATDIKEGNRSISGTLNKAMINGVLLSAALGTVSGSSPYSIVDNTNKALTQFELELFLDQGTNYNAIWIEKVKFDTWEANVANTGDTVIENLEWKGVYKSGQFVGTPASGV